ncbi:MAG TPA: 30S ribosomal protein S13 [Candidatus Thermoplasmatota archaeon]|nr:30S ribosomal protein S13 [Candidatus Thermoplasmatota archaeon]
MAETNPDFKYIVRLANTDLNGEDQVEVALAAVKGIGIRTAGVIAEHAGVGRYAKVGNLTDDQVSKLSSAVDSFGEFAPTWMLNRQKDIETGDDVHVHGSDLEGKKRDDLNRLKKIRCYRGVRHENGQKVRGQRSRSNGRTGLTVGVIKKKEGPQPGAEAAAKAEAKGKK